MASGNFRKEREVGRRFDAKRRDRHQASKRQGRLADHRQEPRNLGDRAAALLLFFADIHLDVGDRRTAGFGGLPPQCIEQRPAVDGVNRVEQRDRLSGLVGLKPADTVKAQARISSEQRWPFRERFLNPVLAEVTLAGLDQALDFVRRAALADGDHLDLLRVAPGERRGPLDSREDVLSSLRGAAHACAL